MKKLLTIVLLLALASPAVAQKGGSRSGGSSYSSGSRSFSSGSRSFSSGSKSPGYSSGSNPPVSSAAKPSKSSIDSGASRAAKVSESRAAYQASKPVSKPTETKIAAAAASATKPRVERERVVYRNVPTTVIYRDTFHPGLDSYLLSQSANTLAMFLYAHRAEMDEARYRDLLARNAEARVKLAELEAKHAAVDPTYCPPGIDYDLLYQAPPPSGITFWGFFKFCLIVVGVIVVIFVIALIVENYS